MAREYSKGHRAKTMLIAGVSALSLGTGAGLASSAWAQAPVAAPAAEVAEVVVTGTSIRGVAPIGSNLVSVGRDVVEKTAAINATELTNTVPAITTSGAAPVGENVFSYFSPQIHSLAGSASNTTLVIVDGLRMPGGGTQFGQTDPNILPNSAIQRVEVLADGASSVYGSDAVAGVVNYILRRSFDGVEISGRAGRADGWRNYDLGGIWGANWDSGGVYVAASHSYQSPLNADKRDFLSMGDYRPVGGRNVQSYACSPATIRTPASGNNTYLSPTATTAVANTPDNAPCNLSPYGAAIQSNQRSNVLVRVSNQFGERLTVTGTVNYNYLTGSRRQGPGSISNATAFGPGSNRAGQINPFYVAPAGDPNATQESVTWAAILPGDNYGTQSASNDTFYAFGNIDYKLTDTWSVKLSNSLGRSRSSSVSSDVFCGPCALLALNGTSQASGSLTASAVSGANVVALNTPLTAANALDVWQPNGGRTSASLLQRLYSNNSSLTHWNSFNQTKLEIQGELFHMPAGPVRTAVGGEYMWNTQKVYDVSPSAIGNSLQGANYTSFDLERSVYSAYAELVVPLVSPEMGVPMVRRLDLNLSGRYDNYQDVGETTNPKVAANWEVVEGVRLRGNYATAFVAPPMASIGIPSLGYQRSADGAGVSGSFFVPLDLYPEARQLPGCATAVGTCQIGTGINQGLSRSYGIGPGAKPQTGNSWSVGLDFSPPSFSGFTASVTWWANKFEGGVNRPNVTQQLYSAALHDRLTLCPSGCTAAQINAFTNSANGGTLNGTLPATVYFLNNNDQGNLLNLNVQGIDFNVNYRLMTESAGVFTIGGSGTYYTKFTQSFGDTPFSVLNTSGFNSTFPSIQQRYRFHLGWELGRFSIDGFLNYTGKYRNWANGAIIPVTTTAGGIPNGGGDIVKANSVFDLHAEYDLDVAFLKRGSVYIDAKNVFNDDPPFYSGNTGGIGVGGYGYNAFVSNPLGRVVSVGFRAGF